MARGAVRICVTALVTLGFNQDAWAQLAILDSWEKVEYADSGDFKTSVSVRLSKSEPVGYVIRLANDDDMPTSSFTRLYKMVPITVSVASYSGGQTGTFYDAVVPLLSANLEGTVYVYAEYDGNASAGPQTITLTQTGETVTLNVTVVDNTLTPDTKFLYIAMPSSYITYGHYKEYVSGSEALGKLYSQLMADHRIAPFGGWVSEPPVNGGRIDYDTGAGGWTFRTEVLDFYTGEDNFTMFNFTTQTKLEAAEVAVTTDSQTGVWFYTCDEPPNGCSKATAEARITAQGTYAPSIKSLVTTSKSFGLSPEPDIFCPVINWLEDGTHGDEADYAANELWLYTSCMEHGCGTDRNVLPNDPPFSGTASGEPGLIIDHVAAHIYAFIGMPMRYTSVQGLLYYNAGEGHRLYRHGRDIDIWIDQFNFGGNGDGALMYPLRDGMFGNSGEGAAGSIRFKIIRSAEYLMDYVEQASPAQEAACNASALITDTNTFELDADVWRTFRDCLLDELGFADEGEGTPVLRNPIIRALDTKVSVTLGMPELLYESNCTAVVKTSPGGTTVETITSTEGLAVRTLHSSVALDASTAYTVEQACEGANTDAQPYAFMTKATPAGGDRTVPISAGDPVVYSTAARATVEYDDNPGLGSPETEQNTDCASGCTINLTLAAGQYYYRWIWQTAADATLAVSAIQPLQVE